MTLLLDLEYYPKLPDAVVQDAVKEIKENMKNWAHPFFMDVYGYADLDKFREIIKPFVDRENLKHLIILGTGGSIQTMKALEGLTKLEFHPITSSRPRELVHVLNACSPEESLVIPISRGGKTLDVNSTIHVFKDYPKMALSSKGPMYEYVKSLDIPILPVPDLSGRFAASICSVALVPAMISGIDVELFLENLATGYSEFKDLHDFEKNYALQYATYLYSLYNDGYRNIFSMPYSSYLMGTAGLFVQEISESSGKNHKGLLGTKQTAPLCQHSVLELLLGGSKGHTSPLLWTVSNEPDDIPINNPEFGLENQTALNIINHQADATFQALLGQKIPAAKLNLKNISVPSLAHAIAFVQSTIYYFCMLLNVNWESNPLVNVGKKICNEAIAANKNPEQRRSERVEVAKKHLGEMEFTI